MVKTPFQTTIVNPIDVYPVSLQKLISRLQQTTNFTPAQVKDFVLEADISEQDLMFWADFQHPITDSYGRKLVFDGGHFEIMVMSWLPGDFSAIHDHGATQWGAVQCFGAAAHYIYGFTKGVLRTLKPAHYTPGMVCTVDHNLIHQMGNPGNTPFLSLHVYGCQEFQETITGNARIFDLLESRIQYTDGGVFFCLPETKINHHSSGLKADRETTLRQHYLMSDRIERILRIQQNADLEKRLTRLQEKIEQLSSP
ncbi:MAG: cysteine dioxygenase [Symploca sp. SIO2E6]|nr:cysteine dioxygenase [Symploca sp. SIO2E6]